MSSELQLTDGHAVVLGQTGLGKTALVTALIQDSPPAWGKILVADSQEEYGRVAVGVHSIEEWAGYVGSAGGAFMRWKVAYQADDLDLVLPALCEAVYDIGQGALFVAEEADLWCSPAAIIPELAHLLKYGRKRGAWVLSVARRPSEIHRLLTSQARYVVAFGTVEPVDLDYLRRAVAVQFTDVVQQLEPLEAACWDRRVRQLVRVRVDPAALRVTIDREEPPAVG